MITDAELEADEQLLAQSVARLSLQLQQEQGALGYVRVLRKRLADATEAEVEPKQARRRAAAPKTTPAPPRRR